MRIEGRCHYGNLGFALETARTWETIGPLRDETEILSHKNQ